MIVKEKIIGYKKSGTPYKIGYIGSVKLLKFINKKIEIKEI